MDLRSRVYVGGSRDIISRRRREPNSIMKLDSILVGG